MLSTPRRAISRSQRRSSRTRSAHTRAIPPASCVSIAKWRGGSARLQAVAVAAASYWSIAAAFDTRDERERKLICATAKLAQWKLLRDYRTLPDAEAALAARVFFKTVWIMQIHHPPVCREMLRRFPFELAGGGHYEPPPFYRDGDPRVI